METEDVLVDGGYVVVGPAVDVDTALSFIAETSIDAAVLDVNLSGEDVFPVAEKLHELSIPFLFLTAYPSSVLSSTAFAQCVVVEKPFLSDRLLTQLAKLLEISKQTLAGSSA